MPQATTVNYFVFDFYEKRKIRSWLYSKVTIGLIATLALLVFVSVYKRYQVERQVAERRAAAEAELKELKERAVFLEEKVSHLENERGLEEEIRTRFDVAKEGEQVVIILENENETPVSQAALEPTAEPSFFSRLKFW